MDKLDPNTASAGDKLAQWAIEMGFAMPDGSIPDNSYFYSATNTPNRRQFWTAFMEKVRDRREVKKIRHKLSIAGSENFLPESVRNERRQQDKIIKTRREIDRVEQELAQGIQKLEKQGERIAGINKCTDELKRKLILVRALRYQQKQDLDWSIQVNDSLLQLLGSPQLEDTKLPLLDIVTEVAAGWRDPTLPDAIDKRIQEAGAAISCHILETAQQTCQEFKQACETVDTEAQARAVTFSETAPALPEHPAHFYCNLVTATIVNDGLLHWFAGKDLEDRAKIFCPGLPENEDEDLALEIASRIVEEDTSVEAVPDLEQELAAWREKVDDQQKAYESLRHEVMELQKCVVAAQNCSADRHRRLVDAEAAYSPSSGDIASWTKLLQSRATLARAQCQHLWHGPLKDENAVTSNEQILNDYSSFWNELSDQLNERLNCVLPVESKRSLGNQEGVGAEEPENGDWTKEVGRSLKRSINTAAALVPKIQAQQRSFQLMIDQKFGDMIPGCVQLQGLTFNAIETQHKLNVKLAGHVSNQSRRE